MSRPSSAKLLRGSPGEWSTPQPKVPSLAPHQGSGPDAAVRRTCIALPLRASRGTGTGAFRWVGGPRWLFYGGSVLTVPRLRGPWVTTRPQARPTACFMLRHACGAQAPRRHPNRRSPRWLVPNGCLRAGVIDSDGREWFNGCSSFCQSCWWQWVSGLLQPVGDGRACHVSLSSALGVPQWVNWG